LVEVYSSSITTHNLVLAKGKPYFVRLMGNGFLEPKTKILGTDIAGRVVEVGKNVKLFQPGDEVFGMSSNFGVLAEYASVPENELAHKPTNISLEEAAAIPQAALVALQGLRDKGKIKSGQKVLINGASGGIGTFAVQIAKYFGAEVTGVCSTRNLNMVHLLGSDHVIDYTEKDFAKNKEEYDLIFGIAYRSIFANKRALKSNGIYVSAGSPSIKRVLQDIVFGSLILKAEEKKMEGGWSVNPNVPDLLFIKELIELGKIKPVIDRSYPLNKISEAFQYYEKGHSQGRVIITIKS